MNEEDRDMLPLDQAIERAIAGEPWVFVKDDKPVAVLIGYDEYERLKSALEF